MPTGKKRCECAVITIASLMLLLKDFDNTNNKYQTQSTQHTYYTKLFVQSIYKFIKHENNHMVLV